MSHILLISGSPTASSKSGALLDYVSQVIRSRGLIPHTFSIRDFHAEDLIHARYDSPEFDDFKRRIAEADGIVVATPIYKASYTGGLKALLDILPQGALRGKTLLPIATGGTSSHLLAIDYALKPVLAVLGASDIQQGVFIVDSQFKYEDEDIVLESELQTRLDEGIDRLIATVEALQPAAVTV